MQDALRISSTGTDILSRSPGGGHRPDIDGLRAIAVLAVLVFHSFARLLPGGFVGVDVFFVISGFLITGIIVSDLQRGRFSYEEFYSRRIRRIFPALTLVLICTLGFGWFVLIPTELSEVGKHGTAGALFGSNLALWLESGYFDQAAQTKPLLHLWSLGIEEQFYIFWPVFLTLTWKRFRNLLPVVCGLSAVSFAFSVWLLRRDASAAFYFPLSRGWELMMGGALACWTIQRKGRIRHYWLQNVSSLMGLLSIGFAMCWMAESKPFPGWYALIPTVGTVMVIAAGPEAYLNRLILSAGPSCFVGRISYALYLWHWPALVYLGLINASDWHLNAMGKQKVVVLVGSGVAAWVTWKFAESPFRVTAVPDPIKVRRLVCTMAAVCVVAMLANTGVWKSRLSSPQLTAALEGNRREVFFKPRRADNIEKSSGFGVDWILSGSTHKSLFVGDSHMGMYWPRAVVAIQQDPRLANAAFAVYPGCPPLPNLNGSQPRHFCPQFYDYWLSMAKRDATIDTVAISAFWSWYIVGDSNPLRTANGRLASQAEVERSWQRFTTDIAELVRMRKRVILFSESPVSSLFQPQGSLRRLAWHGLRPMEGARLSELAPSIEPVNRRLTEVAKRSGAEVIRPVDYLCGSTTCPATDAEGFLLYRDNNHLRMKAASEKAVFIDIALKR